MYFSYKTKGFKPFVCLYGIQKHFFLFVFDADEHVLQIQNINL